MGSPLPPDPYLALGVEKDAPPAAIKTQYRKLVLKFHPDKVQDESAKQAAADKFHEIQTAYEIVGDDHRRQRYDAQVRLAELRREAMERGGATGRGGAGVDVRTAAYQVPTETPRGGDFYARGPERSARMSPEFEVRMPSYAEQEYERPSKHSARKDHEHERPPKRTSAREERERTRPSAKEVREKERNARSKRTERDVRRDRERKFAHVSPAEESESDSDEWERMARKRRDEDELRRAQYEYYEGVRRQQEEAAQGYFVDERARKYFSQEGTAKDYIQRSHRGSKQQPEAEPRRASDAEPRRPPEPEPRRASEAEPRRPSEAEPRRASEAEPRRPSPHRNQSSRDTTNHAKGQTERPTISFRRGSGDTKGAKKSSRPSTGEKTRSSRSKEPRATVEIVDEPREPSQPRKMPPLQTSKSSPADIRPPFTSQRSYSVQVEPEIQEEQQRPAPLRRADTMPQTPTARESSRRKDPSPHKGSRLRQTETVPDTAYLTPEPTPEPTPMPSRKYHYGQEYADDVEYPTPDGYRTEIREPATASVPRSSRRYTRSPSPLARTSRSRDAGAERQRSTSSRYPSAAAQPVRTTSTQYVFSDRPQVSRENSGRGSGGARLFGEVPTTATANPSASAAAAARPSSRGQQQHGRHSSSEDPVAIPPSVQRVFADVSYKTGAQAPQYQSGYRTRSSGERGREKSHAPAQPYLSRAQQAVHVKN